jgi:ABC-type transport system substrate-binding protein
MTEESSLDLGNLTRRDLTAMGILASQTALAGCGGTAPDGTPVQGGDGGEGTTDEDTIVSRVAWSYPPGDVNMNRFAALSDFPGAEAGVFFDPLVSYSPVENRYVYVLADGPPQMEGCEHHVYLKDTYQWWDGTPVTAEDWVVRSNIIPYFCCGGPEEVYWNAELVDTYEFMEMKSGVFNESFASSNMMSKIFTKSGYYESYLERLSDASTEDQVSTIVKELRDLSVTLEEFVDEGLGYGLWKPVEYSSSRVVLEKHEGHPMADRTDLERWEWQVVPTSQSFIQAFKQNRFDYGHAEYQRNVQRPPENVETVVSYSGRSGRKLGINWRNEHLSRLAVRRAIAYLIDREAIADVLPSISPVEYQTGTMPDSLAAKWVGEDFLEDLIDYGVQSKPEKAADVMRSAGYERRNGVWTDEDGNKIDGLRFIATSNDDEALLGNTMSEQLSNFGMKNTFNAIEAGSFQSIMSPRTGSADFDLALDNGGPSSPHPAQMWIYLGPSTDNYQTVARIREQEECGTEPPSIEWTDDATHVYKIPVDPAPSFPETVGADSLDGGEQTLRPIRDSFRLRYDIGEDRIREISRNFAWWINYNAFHVFLHTFDRNLWMDTANYSLRDDTVVRGVNHGASPMADGNVRSRD